MEAGQLRQRVTLLQASTQKDTFGGVKNPVAFATVWGKVKPLMGKDLYAAQQRVSEVTHQVTIRYLDGVKAKHFVDFNGRIFRITYVMNPEELGEQLQLLCVEINDSANQTPALILVSGSVTGQFATVTVTFTGPSTVTVNVDGDGNFSALLLPGDYVVTATKVGSTITPSELDITVDSEVVTGLQFSVAGGF